MRKKIKKAARTLKKYRALTPPLSFPQTSPKLTKLLQNLPKTFSKTSLKLPQTPQNYLKPTRTP